MQKFKKVTHQFKRFNSHRFKRIRTGWRRPRGIDNPMRRRFKGQPAMPRIGYRTDKRYRYRANDGKYRVNVNNVSDLEMLMMQRHRMAAVISHNVSFRKRKAIVKRARELAVKVVNATARCKRQEK